MFGEQVEGVHAANAQQFAHVALAEPADAPAQLQQVQAIGPQPGAQPGRRGLQHGVQRCGKTPHLLREPQVGVGVRGHGEPRGSGSALPQHQWRVRAQRHRGQCLGRPTQAVSLEFQLADELCRHLVEQMCASRDAESGRKLACHGRSAESHRCFQYQHRAARAREQAGAGQAVVPAADDDAVVPRQTGGNGVHAPALMRRSRSTARAAFAPGAPITPPPGCVLEPHRYRPRSGVRYCA